MHPEGLRVLAIAVESALLHAHIWSIKDKPLREACIDTAITMLKMSPKQLKKVRKV
jgi:hypothetical protein